jgi:hypothetical protein
MQPFPNISPTAAAGSFEDGGKMTCSASPGKAGESFDHLISRALPPISNEVDAGEDIFPPQAKNFKSSGQTTGKDRPKTTGGNPHSGANSSATLEANVMAVNPENVSIQIVVPVAAVVDGKNELTARAPDANNPGKIPTVVAESKNGSLASTKISSPGVSQNQPGVEASADVKSDAQVKIAAAVEALAGEKTNSTSSKPSTSSSANPQVPPFAKVAPGDLPTPMLADKPVAQSPQSGLPASPDLQGKVTLQAGTDMNGTSVAKQEVQMKKAENTNKTDSPAGKILPDASVSVARENNLPPRETVSATVLPRDGQMTATIAANSSPADSTVEVAQPSGDLAAGAASADLRSRSLDRVQDMVVLHAARLGDSDNVSLQVVIKPGAGTQLSLELRQRGDGVEAQAVLQRGDFAHLNQHWPALQQQLEPRGIRLAPLVADENFAGGGGNNFQPKQNQPAETDSFSAGAFAEVAPSVLTAPTAANARTHRGWESWA